MSRSSTSTPATAGEGLENRQQRLGGQRRRLVGLGVDDLHCRITLPTSLPAAIALAGGPGRTVGGAAPAGLPGCPARTHAENGGPPWPTHRPSPRSPPRQPRRRCRPLRTPGTPGHPERVAGAYTEDSVWRNRDTLVTGREEIVAFLAGKWERELDYALRKSLWTFNDNRIAVRFQYESHDPGRASGGAATATSCGSSTSTASCAGARRASTTSAIDASQRRIFGPRPESERGDRDPPAVMRSAPGSRGTI